MPDAMQTRLIRVIGQRLSHRVSITPTQPRSEMAAMTRIQCSNLNYTAAMSSDVSRVRAIFQMKLDLSVNWTSLAACDRW